MPELDRRDFLRLVGLGAGAAAAAGCSDPIEKLVPYVVQPAVITPGIPVYYSSTCRECPAACGLHVKTREGRPVKLEGNPSHPVNQGKLCARGQAGIGRTYHPDRYEGPMARGADGKLAPITWEEAEAKLAEKLRAAGAKTWVLGADRGPTVNGIIDRFVAGVGAGGRVVYEPFSHDALRAASALVFGEPVLPIFDVSGADLIVDFGSDFLDGGLFSIESNRQFAEAQDLEKHANGGARLVHVGPRLSMTASNADEWIPASAGSEGIVALALAAAVYEMRKAHGDPIPGDRTAIESALRGVDTRAVASQVGIEVADLEKLAKRVLAAKSAVALPPGVAATGPQATATAAAVMLLNAMLGALGTAVVLPEQETAPAPANLDALRRLTDKMNGGEVAVLLVHDANPVYSMPGGLGFPDAMSKVDFVVSFAALQDETSAKADLVLPDLTPLESWGDAEPRKGVRSLQQPTIRPLKSGRAPRRHPALGGTRRGRRRAAGGNDLRRAAGQLERYELARGPGSRRRLREDADEDAEPDALRSPTSPRWLPKLEGEGEHTLVAYAHSMLSDGSGAALPWLQEIPDPVTKASWQSWAEISNETARRLGVDFGDVIRVDTGLRSRLGGASGLSPGRRARRRGRRGDRAGPHRRPLRLDGERRRPGRRARREHPVGAARRLGRGRVAGLPHDPGEAQPDRRVQPHSPLPVDRQPA